ncbi:Nucleolar protein 9 [Malassezia yamatoensis]|uniref:Nucleolar protein 9 n=1 Tax=Malassezia yamatoensis TaxID=253288 RepID=A0AAJ6CFR4_9BASI|nr:Nucleolar protein 9 [Malassezia yamatoensis]
MVQAERRRAPKRSKHEALEETEQEDETEWIRNKERDANTPFGLVAPEMQAYFKEVNASFISFLHSEDPQAGEEEAELLLQAALNEMDGSELSLATDPTCSLVLENMLNLMKEKALRVFFDRMSGNYIKLATHRYGSHVLQSMLISAQNSIAKHHGEQSIPKRGEEELRSLPQLVEVMFRELETAMEIMLTDPFATHVLRSLVGLLTGVPISCLEDLRSKRSSKYRSKERQRAMVDFNSNHTDSSPVHVPPHFLFLTYELYEGLHSGLHAQTLYRLLPDPVAAPTLSLLLKLESGLRDGKKSMAEREDSLNARILGDLRGNKQRSDIIEAAIRDAVATHVLESTLQCTSSSTLARFYKIYISGRVAKLGGHPCANFVVSTIFRRLPAEAGLIASAISELKQAGDQLVKNQVSGVFQALLERCAKDQAHEQEAQEALFAAFRFTERSDSTLFVPVLLSMHTLKAYKHTFIEKKNASKQDSRDPYTMQGSLLLQQFAKLHPPHQDALYISLAESQELQKWCCSPTAVHVVLSALSSPSASFAQRRSLLRKILPLLVELSDDSWGSRVADAVWDAADGYTKDKIAQIAVENEKQLLSSAYGRYFVKRLRLGVYRKSYGDWKDWAKSQTPTTGTTTNALPGNVFEFLRKRRLDRHAKSTHSEADQQLENILSAIQ